MRIGHGVVGLALCAAIVSLFSCRDDYAEAPPADGGAIRRGCDASFCDDFDDKGTVGDGWDGLSVAAGQVSFETANVRSTPNALRSTIVHGNGVLSASNRTAMVKKTLPAGKRVTCSFAMYILQDFSDAHAPVQFVAYEASGLEGTNGYALRLAMRSPYDTISYVNASLREEHALPDGGCACPKSQQVFQALDSQKWVRITFQADFVNGTATVKYDDAVAYAGGTFAKFTPAQLVLYLGISTKSGGGPGALYDDLECKVE